MARRCTFDINIGNRFAYRKFRAGKLRNKIINFTSQLQLHIILSNIHTRGDVQKYFGRVAPGSTRSIDFEDGFKRIFSLFAIRGPFAFTHAIENSCRILFKTLSCDVHRDRKESFVVRVGQPLVHLTVWQ